MVFETTLSECESMEDEYISQKVKLISNDPKVVFSDAKVENVVELPTVEECMSQEISDIDESKMEVTLTPDKNLVTSQGLITSQGLVTSQGLAQLSQAISQGLITSQGQLITVNSGDLLNIQVSTNGLLPTSNGMPLINGSMTTASTTPTSPTTTRCSSMTTASSTTTTTMPVKIGGKSPTCRVCGDESSGFHYGVDSCEGCKGFFRRCITQGMTHKCSNEEKCEITPFTRNSCQYCRLKKCFEVGMSREASRLGRRPKRLKDSSGEAKQPQVNLPIAPYPSPAELYKLRMAELQRLLQQNGTFKSELMQAFLSAAQVSFREHQRHNNNNDNKKNVPQLKKEPYSPTSTTSSLSPTTTDTASVRNNNYQNVDNKDALLSETPDNFLASQELNLLNRDIIPTGGEDTLGYTTIKTEPDYDNYTCLSQQTQSMTNTGSPSSPEDVASPFNMPALSPDTLMMMPDMMSDNSMQQMMGMMSGMMSGGFDLPMDLPEPDPNANFIDIDRILEEVKQVPSDLRSQLIEQVIETVGDAHMATVRPTYQSVAEANARLEKMKADGELPDLSKLSISPDKMWQEFVESMVLEITAAVKFCKKLPGFGEIEQDDQIILIKKGSFEILNCRMCMLVDHVNGLMFDPNIKMKCPRAVIKSMPMGFFIDEFFNVAEQFNPIQLTDREIGIFSAVLLMCPERDDLKNVKAIEKLSTLYLQSLYVSMKRNHVNFEDKFCKVCGVIPVFRYINQKHSMALNSMKMQNAEVVKEFPPLHKEVYDLDK